MKKYSRLSSAAIVIGALRVMFVVKPSRLSNILHVLRNQRLEGKQCRSDVVAHNEPPSSGSTLFAN